MKNLMMKAVSKLIKNSLIAGLAIYSQASIAQVLTVSGELGQGQIDNRVKAFKCEVDLLPEGITLKKNSCKQAFALNLNTTASMQAGYYILGFSNTIYPGIIEMKAGSQVNIKLEKIMIPQEAQKRKIRIYRDFSSLIEQKKLLLSQFGVGRSFFQLSEYEFGDYYLRYAPQSEIFGQKNYSGCDVVRKRLNDNEFTQERAESVQICNSLNQAKTFMGYTELFDFDDDGRLVEMWVRPTALDVHKLKHKRHLVALPLDNIQTDQAFVSVFPGAYKLSSDGGKPITINIKVPNVITEVYGVEVVVDQMLSKSADQLKIQNQQLANATQNPLNGGQSVALACDDSTKVWKTEYRAYCRADTEEGCNRAATKLCVDMRKVAPKEE